MERSRADESLSSVKNSLAKHIINLPHQKLMKKGYPMNRIFKILVVVLLLAIVPSITYAQSCTSAAQVVADVWEKAGEVAMAIGCGVATVAGGVDFSTCYASANFLSELTSTLIGWWNSVVDNSWATIGPRLLELNTDLDGKLVSTSGRMFVSLPIATDKITVTIDERDGKAKTSVVVCKHDKKGNATQVATKWFNDTNDKQKKTDEHREVVVTGAKDHIISVHLDAKSVANTFSYTVRAK
jgi:hypothetical protein